MKNITKQLKQRQSNIELCRIFAILMVLLVHSQFLSLGQPTNRDISSIITLFLQSASLIGVNVFVMISGYFSIRLKLKSILNLFYICLFCTLVTIIIDLYQNSFDFKYLFFLSKSNWFVIDYLGLMVMSPLLNSFLEHNTKKTILITLIVVGLYQLWFGWYPGQNNDFNNGRSILSFCYLYILARFLHQCNINWKFKYSFFMYLISTLFITLSLSLFVPIPVQDYNNPLLIASSIGFLGMFLATNIKYNSKINTIAKSTLTVLLLHISDCTFVYVKDLFIYIHHFPLAIYLFVLLPLCIIIIFATCVLIDQIRLITYPYVEKSILPSAQYLYKKINLWSETFIKKYGN